jgi:Magnesium transporter NIPA
MTAMIYVARELVPLTFMPTCHSMLGKNPIFPHIYGLAGQDPIFQVSPIYYVFFTIFVMIASGILYGEYSSMTWCQSH